LDVFPTVVSQLYSTGQIKQPVVGFFLARDGDVTDSEMALGDVTTGCDVALVSDR